MCGNANQREWKKTIKNRETEEKLGIGLEDKAETKQNPEVFLLQKRKRVEHFLLKFEFCWNFEEVSSLVCLCHTFLY